MSAQTVFDAFAAAARTSPGAAFLIVPSTVPGKSGSGLSTTRYGEALEAVVCLKEAYRAAGIEARHRVALLLENRPEMVLHFLALNALGAGIVPVNPDYSVDEMRYLIEHSEAALIVTTAQRLDELERVAQACMAPVPVVRGDAEDFAAPVITVRAPSEPMAALLYTSGTTGRPKGCMLSDAYFMIAGQTYASCPGLVALRAEAERFYNPLPLYHMNHLAVTLTAALLTRNALILTDRFSPQRWWPEIIEARATVVHYLGVIAALLMAAPPAPLDRAHSVRLGIGAGIEPELHPTIEARFGFPFVEVWGMTETGRVTINAVEPRQIDTRAFGRGFDGLELGVVDDADQPVPIGTPGELVVRSSAEDPRYGFFSGYLKNPAATDEAWRNGWFHTGDIVRLDETGMAYFIDRRKNIIRRAGENIAAAEVEAVLQAHDAVLQVGVLAVPDAVREEEVMAAIVLQPGFPRDQAMAETLFAHARASLAYFKAPGWIVFLDRLPTTGTQKIQKGQIFAPGSDPRNHPAAIDLRRMKRRG